MTYFSDLYFKGEKLFHIFHNQYNEWHNNAKGLLGITRTRDVC